MPAVAYPHIELRETVPYIEGTQTKVVEIVISRLAYNWDADEIRRQLPHLNLGQIHSALAYYYDHQTEVDAEIERRLRLEQELIDKLGESPIRLKLQAAKRAGWKRSG